MVVASWLLGADWLLLDVDRLLADSSHLVLFDNSVARGALLACLHRRATEAVEIDAIGDQSTDEEDPLNGAERSSSFGRISWAIGNVAVIGTKAINVILKAHCEISNNEVYSSDGGEPGPGPEP